MTPETIKEDGQRVQFVREWQYVSMLRLVSKKGHEGKFNRSKVRLLIDQGFGKEKIYVDQEGVFSKGTIQYQLTPLNFLKLDQALTQLLMDDEKHKTTARAPAGAGTAAGRAVHPYSTWSRPWGDVMFNRKRVVTTL